MNREMRRASKANGRRLMKQGWTDFEDKTLEAHLRGIRVVQGMKSILVNSTYSVQIFPKKTQWGEVTLLMVRRHDEAPIRSWSDMQRIKNEIMGPERVAIEVYPSESNLVDQANMYHLWVLPETFDLPFGLHKTSESETADMICRGRL